MMRDKTSLYLCIGILQAACWFLYSLRLYTRLVELRKPALDDVVVGLAMVCATLPSPVGRLPSSTSPSAAAPVAHVFSSQQITYTVFGAFAVRTLSCGVGHKIYSDAARRDDWSRANLNFFVTELAFVAVGCLLRQACGLMLLRILAPGEPAHRPLRCIIWATVGFMALYSSAFFFVSLFQCSPVSYFWTYVYDTPADPPHGVCMYQQHLSGRWTVMSVLLAVHSLVCCISDWILGAVPFFILRGLQISARRKVLATALLSLGILAGVVALIRAPLYVYPSPSPGPGLLTAPF